MSLPEDRVVPPQPSYPASPLKRNKVQQRVHQFLHGAYIEPPAREFEGQQFR